MIFVRYFIQAILTLLCGLFVLFCILAVLWHAWFLCALSLGAALVFLPLGVKIKKLWIARACLLGLVATLAIVYVQVPFAEIQNRAAVLRQRLNQGGSGSLGVLDKVSIYGANLAMAAGAAATGMPEVAMETALLCWPGPKQRVFNSDFAMKSLKVRQAIYRFATKLKPNPSARASNQTHRTRIAWKGYFHDSPRVALALNPFLLEVKAAWQEGRWRLACSGKILIKYPRRSWTKLLVVRGQPFYFEEGLFWALQQQGWMFPYKANWRWNLWWDGSKLTDE